MSHLLILGARHGALKAAQRLGYEAIETHTPGLPVRAVLACKEKTVLEAARLRSWLSVPGTDMATAQRCHVKTHMKRAIAAAKLPLTPWREIQNSDTAGSLGAELGFPFIVKAPNASGGRGTRRVSSAGDALAPVGWLAERLIPGLEMSVESFVAEGRVLWSNPTQYLVVNFANVVPAPIEAELWERVRAFNDKVIHALGIEQGMTHLEIYVQGASITFGELALRPPGGCLMPLIERAYGFCPWEKWIQVECGEVPDFPVTHKRYAGVLLLHPGQGTLKEIQGVEAAKALPHIRKVKMRAEVGQIIPPREGTGQDVGRVFAEGKHADEIQSTLLEARKLIRFMF